MKSYIVRAAMNDEANSGWIWLDGYSSRTLIKVRRPLTRRTVYMEARQIDHNFRSNYNQPPRRAISKDLIDTTVTMSEWYRNALGGFGTTRSDNQTGLVDLRIRKSRFTPYAALRAACLHPDLSVRLGTRLGAVGVWLGATSLLPAVIAFMPLTPSQANGSLLFAVALMTGVLGYVCRGARPPKGSKK